MLVLFEDSVELGGEGDFLAGGCVDGNVDGFGGADEFCGIAEDLVEEDEGGLADVLTGDVDVEEIADFELGVVVGFAVDDNEDKFFFCEDLIEIEPFTLDEIF